jgi:GNAT superfamily N-acetyltransferase
MRVESLSICPAPLGSPAVRELILALNAELSARYPEAGATHFRLDEEEVAPGRGVLLLCRKQGMAIGCGALRTLDQTSAELKRMYVVPAERGHGVGRVLLDELLRHARALGRTRLVLETGVRQPDAIALYSRYGFQQIPPWGEYLGSTLSVCMAMDLVLPLGRVSDAN